MGSVASSEVQFGHYGGRHFHLAVVPGRLADKVNHARAEIAKIVVDFERTVAKRLAGHLNREAQLPYCTFEMRPQVNAANNVLQRFGLKVSLEHERYVRSKAAG